MEPSRPGIRMIAGVGLSLEFVYLRLDLHGEVFLNVDDGVIVVLAVRLLRILPASAPSAAGYVSRPRALKPMTVSLPPMTAILYIQITQPFPDGLRGDACKPTREDHSDRGYLALDRRHIGDRHPQP